MIVAFVVMVIENEKGASINYVDKQGEGGVLQMSTILLKLI